ncbi:MAG: hypothetical protein QW520_00570 [Methanomassiliicoccales archaeon]
MRTRPEDVYLEGMEFEPDVVEWMKQHKVREIKALAKEVEEHGEDASELKEFYKELKKIEKEWHQIVSSKEGETKRMPPAV